MVTVLVSANVRKFWRFFKMFPFDDMLGEKFHLLESWIQLHCSRLGSWDEWSYQDFDSRIALTGLADLLVKHQHCQDLTLHCQLLFSSRLVRNNCTLEWYPFCWDRWKCSVTSFQHPLLLHQKEHGGENVSFCRVFTRIFEVQWRSEWRKHLKLLLVQYSNNHSGPVFKWWSEY